MMAPASSGAMVSSGQGWWTVCATKCSVPPTWQIRMCTPQGQPQTEMSARIENDCITKLTMNLFRFFSLSWICLGLITWVAIIGSLHCASLKQTNFDKPEKNNLRKSCIDESLHSAATPRQRCWKRSFHVNAFYVLGMLSWLELWWLKCFVILLAANSRALPSLLSHNLWIIQIFCQVRKINDQQCY